MKIKNYFKMYYLSWGNFAVKEYGTKKKESRSAFFSVKIKQILKNCGLGQALVMITIYQQH